jgi:hypothetical protein
MSDNLTVRVSKPYGKVNQSFSTLAYEPQGFSPDSRGQAGFNASSGDREFS